MGAQRDVAELLEVLGVASANLDLLREAMTDPSYLNEAKAPAARANEPLAFLGDAVVGLVVRHELMKRHPEWDKGALSKAKDAVVSDGFLARAARRRGLGPFLLLGNADRDRDNPTVLARAFEALIGAIHADKGFDASADVCRRWLDVPSALP